MRLFQIVVVVAVVFCAGCRTMGSDKYGADGPCAYIYKQAGGSCLDGVVVLETEIGPARKVLASKVISASASSFSSGPIDAIAHCMADHMSYFEKWYVHEPDRKGKQLQTIHVVNANTCDDPRYLRK